MQVLTEWEGFTTLSKFGIGILQTSGKQAAILDALVQDIVGCLETITIPPIMQLNAEHHLINRQKKTKKNIMHNILLLISQ